VSLGCFCRKFSPSSELSKILNLKGLSEDVFRSEGSKF
jgi:hypothetical protein